jgi:hypothetical protein
MSGIGDVPNITDFVSQMLEIPKNHVEGHEGATVPQVHIAVYRWTTNIHAYVAFVYGLEHVFFSGKRVMDA